MYGGNDHNNFMAGSRTSNDFYNRPTYFRKTNLCGAEKRRRKIAKLKAEGIYDQTAFLKLRNRPKTFQDRPTINANNKNGELGSDMKPVVKAQSEDFSSDNIVGMNIVQNETSGSKLCKNVAIVPQDYPKRTILKDELHKFQDSLGSYIDTLPDNGFLPKLHTIWSNSGCVLVFCKDLQTVEWLTSNINLIKPWNGADLKVISRDALAERVTLWVPGSKVSTDLVLKRIQRQNEGVEVTSWHVIERKEEEDGFSLELLADKESVKKTLNKSYDLYCGAVKAVLKPSQVF